VDVFNHQRELPGYSRLVPLAEIASEANDYNLNIPRYIDAGEAEDQHDLYAHLNGGIPERDVDALQPYWSVLPGLRDILFTANGRPGYLEPRVATHEVKPAILEHSAFRAFADTVNGVIDEWRDAHRDYLHSLAAGIKPREVIYRLSEDLLERFANVPLLDRYAVYQRLMDYWGDVMQDDVHLIAAEDWHDAARPRGVIDNKERKIKEEPDLTVGSGKKAKKYKLDLIPPALVIARFFAEEQARYEELQAKLEAASQELNEFIEEQEGEEDLLSEVKNDKGNVTKTEIPKRLKVLKDEEDSDDEIAALKQCKKLIEAEADAKRAVKEAGEELNQAVLARYGELSENEIKTLAVDDKWLADIRTAIESEVERITNQLAGRVRELEERYAEPLPDIEREVEALAAKVTGHLEKMGVRVDG